MATLSRGPIALILPSATRMVALTIGSPADVIALPTRRASFGLAGVSSAAAAGPAAHTATRAGIRKRRMTFTLIFAACGLASGPAGPDAKPQAAKTLFLTLVHPLPVDHDGQHPRGQL